MNVSKSQEQAAPEPLAVGQIEARRLLGGISRTSLWKLEKAGLVPALPGLGRKLYSIDTLRRFVGAQR